MAFGENTRVESAAEQAPAPDALRDLVATLVQETLRTEFDQFLGARPYERTPERRERFDPEVATVQGLGGGCAASDLNGVQGVAGSPSTLGGLSAPRVSTARLRRGSLR